MLLISLQNPKGKLEHDILTRNSFHKYVFFEINIKILKNHNNVKCETCNFSIKTQRQ